MSIHPRKPSVVRVLRDEYLLAAAVGVVCEDRDFVFLAVHTEMTPIATGGNDSGFLHVRRGKPVSFLVSDPMLVDSIRALNKQANTPTQQLVMKPVTKGQTKR